MKSIWHKCFSGYRCEPVKRLINRLFCLESLEPRHLLSGTVYVVNSLGDEISDDGLLTLREAIEASNQNVAVNEASAGSALDVDEIRFAPSLFVDGVATMILTNGRLDITDDMKIISNDSEAFVIDATGSSGFIFVINKLDVVVHLAGLTLTGAQVNASGGGVYNYSGQVELERMNIHGNSAYEGGGVANLDTMTIRDSVISGNTSEEEGGGIYNTGYLTISDSEISGNTSDNKGGGVYSESELHISQSTISGNTGLVGGGVYSEGTSFTIHDSTVNENTAWASSGGLSLSGDYAEVVNVSIQNNRSINNNVGGIGIGTADGLILQSTIKNNNARNGIAGGVYVSSPVKIQETIIAGNTAKDGGGIYQSSHSDGSRVINSIVVGNQVSSTGGGVINTGQGSMTVVNSTITGNSASQFPGTNGEITLVNSIVAMNNATLQPGLSDVSGEVIIQNSLVNIDPQFVSLPDDGGDGWGDNLDTPDIDESLNDDFGDLSLLPTSSAINLGDNTLTLDYTNTPLVYDYLDNLRVVHGTVDAGAIEYTGELPEFESPSVVVTTLEDVFDRTDGEVSLREAIMYARDIDQVITFSNDLTGHRIELQYGQYYLNHSLTIDASALGMLEIDGLGFSRIFRIAGVNTQVKLNGMTLRGGSESEGGGIYVDGASLYLDGMTLSDNVAADTQSLYNRGGGVYVKAGYLSVIDSEIKKNDAPDGGTGIYASDSHVLIRNSEVSLNTSSSSGVAVSLDRSRLEIYDTRISDNMGGGVGLTGHALIENTVIENNYSGYIGGIWIISQEMSVLDNVTIRNNSSNTNGGIYNLGKLTVRNSVISDNKGSLISGGIYNDRDAEMVLDHVQVVGNEVIRNSHQGAGVYNRGELSIYQSLIAENVMRGDQASAAGIFNQSTMLTISGSTIAGNLALGENSRSGAFENTSAAKVTFENTIVAHNHSDSGLPDLIRGAYVNRNSILSHDPGFTINPSPGDDGIWGTEDDVSGDYHLTDLSLALNHGDNTLVVNDLNQPVLTDIDGNARIQDGNVDIGVYEFQGQASPARDIPSAIVTTAQDVFDLEDGLTSIREAIFHAGVLRQSVTFDPSLNNQQIILNGESITVDQDVTVDASALDNLILSGDSRSRLFYVPYSDVEMTLQGMTLTGGSDSIGGAIFFAGKKLTILDSILNDNHASSYAGAIRTTGETVIRNSMITGNTAANSSSGGISSTLSLYMSDTTVSHNVSSTSGGGLSVDGYTIIVNSEIFGNRAVIGGGLRSSGETKLYNSVIHSNSAILIEPSNGTAPQGLLGGGANVPSPDQKDYGGGISSEDTLELLNTTVTGNSTSGIGGGIYHEDGNVIIANSIVAGNESAQGEDYVDNEQTFIELTHSIVDYDYKSDLLTTQNVFSSSGPLFMQLPDHGGDGWGDEPLTPGIDESLNDDFGDLTLHPMSQAINWGGFESMPLDILDIDGDNDVTEMIPFDLSGQQRIIHQYVDIGAYEFEGDLLTAEPPSSVVTTLDDDVNLLDGDISLREAIHYASMSDTAITFDASLNNGVIYLNDQQLYIPHSVSIDTTLLDSLTIHGGYQSRIMMIDGVGLEVALSGLTLIGGQTLKAGGAVNIAGADVTIQRSTINGNSAKDGGGIYLEIGSLTLNDVSVLNNTATMSGGGVYNSAGTLDFINVHVNDNDAGSYGGGVYSMGNLNDQYGEYSTNHAAIGGGIYFKSANMSLLETMVIENDNTGYSSVSGAGISNGGNAMLENVTIARNIVNSINSDAHGAGISNSGTMQIINSMINDNVATADDYASGAGISSGPMIHIAGSHIEGNRAIGGYRGRGGGVSAYGGSLIDTRVIRNHSSTYGGGLYLFNETELQNVVVAGNRATSGGGIYLTSSTDQTHTMANIVISNNYADYYGGGIYLKGNATLTHATIAANASGERGAFAYIEDPYELQLNNSIIGFHDGIADSIFIGDVTLNHTITGVDPGFIMDPQIGEDGQWATEDDEYGDLRLMLNSVAINVGNNDLSVNANGFAISQDVDGLSRNVHSKVDLGAYEYQGAVDIRDTASTVVTTNVDSVDMLDGQVSLREAIVQSQATGNPVTFSPALNGQTIQLTDGVIALYAPTTIDASAVGTVTIDADRKTRAFFVYKVPDVTLRNLHVTRGYTENDGGGLYAFESTVTIVNSRFDHHYARDGGAIYTDRTDLRLNASFLAQNRVSHYGGAFSGSGNGVVDMINTVIVGNMAEDGGGGIYYSNGDYLTLTNSTVTANLSDRGGHGIQSNRFILNNSIVVFNPEPNRFTSRNMSGVPEHNNSITNIDPVFDDYPDDGGDGWGDDPNTLVHCHH